MELNISQNVYNSIYKYGNSDLINEVCGAFIGKKTTDTIWECEEFIPMRNISQKGRGSNYTPDPGELFKVLKRTTHMTKGASKDFVGIFHTHPHHLPIPSHTDIYGAGYMGFYMIYSPKYKQDKTYFYDGQERKFNDATIRLGD
tara:strand:+ start:1128 stop:1559 length:432 start_codon:yes stop_codon:yes gene_type:complete